MVSSSKQTKNSIKLSWKAASGTSQYIVYGNKCGKGNKFKRITALSSSGRSFNVKQAAGAKLKKHAGIRYESSNPAVASVSSKGKIKGLKKGKVVIYAFAQNGINKKVKITVK